MTETGQTTASEQADCTCKRIKQGFEDFVNMFLPPEEATKHFREARLEILRGFRAILDSRIEHLKGSGTEGTRVTVE
ncbi:MAG: hypothetical protein WA324_02180 [Bryobacteraceae bacterium]